MATPKITLDQWKTLVSVVESGGYAQAASQLHKSQSTLTYAIQKMERLLGVKAFEIKGRKAQLTDAGHILYTRGKALVEEAGRLEQAAAALAAGWEAEIRLAVEVVFPTWLLLECLAAFGEERPHTRIELYETVLEGNVEALTEGKVDLAIGPTIPQGFVGEALMNVSFVLAAAPGHALHQLGRPIVPADLKPHRHLIIRDTGSRRVRATNAIAAQRWTVSNKATSIRAATMGLGFAWFPEDSVREELGSGQLKALPMREGTERYATLYLIHAGDDLVGKGARRLGEIIRGRVKQTCPESGQPAASP
ncbi:MAG: LysR family transcriptional regulator [Gammaproteobacteria bacterium]